MVARDLSASTGLIASDSLEDIYLESCSLKIGGGCGKASCCQLSARPSLKAYVSWTNAYRCDELTEQVAFRWYFDCDCGPQNSTLVDSRVGKVAARDDA